MKNKKTGKIEQTPVRRKHCPGRHIYGRLSALAVGSCLLLSFLCSGSTGVNAESMGAEELQQQMEQDEQDLKKEQQKISDYKNSLGEVKERIASLEKEQAEAEKKIREMDQLTTEVTLHLVELRKEIEKNRGMEESAEKALAAATEKKEKQYEAMKLRIRYMYEMGDDSLLELFFGAVSLSDLLGKMEMVQRISAYDRDKMEEYEQSVRTVEATAATLKEKQEQLEAELLEEEENAKALDALYEAKSEEMEELLLSLGEEVKTQEKLKKDLDTAMIGEAALEKQIEDASQRIMQIAAEEARKAAEEASRAEESRRAAESLAEELRQQSLAESRRVEESLAESSRLAEAARLAEESRRAEESRLAEESRKAAEGTSSSEGGENGNNGEGGSTEPSESETASEPETSGKAPGDNSEYAEHTTIPVETGQPPYPTYAASGVIHFLWPVPSSRRVTSFYGPRPDQPVAGVASFHNGIDVAAAGGADIVAAGSGIVIYAGDGVETNSSTGGNQVWILHENSYVTTYMHASAVLVQKGDVVSEGQVIALVGQTGLSLGNHLDFRIMPLSGGFLDPLGPQVMYH